MFCRSAYSLCDNANNDCKGKPVQIRESGKREITEETGKQENMKVLY